MKNLKEYGRLKSVSGIICAEDGEHLGDIFTRGSSNPKRCWDGAERAHRLVHCHNHFDEVVEALKIMIDDKRNGPFFHEDEHPAGSDLRRCEAVLAKAKEVK